MWHPLKSVRQQWEPSAYVEAVDFLVTGGGSKSVTWANILPTTDVQAIASSFNSRMAANICLAARILTRWWSISPLLSTDQIVCKLRDNPLNPVEGNTATTNEYYILKAVGFYVKR